MESANEVYNDRYNVPPVIREKRMRKSRTRKISISIKDIQIEETEEALRSRPSNLSSEEFKFLHSQIVSRKEI